MADPVAAPAAPPSTAPATSPAAPVDGGTVTQLRPHHAATQPRAEDGKFIPPPPPATAAPRLLKVEEGLEMPEDELLADYRGRRVEYAAMLEQKKENDRLRAEAERWKEPTKALTPQQRKAIAERELQDFIRREEEAKLPPAEQERLARFRAIEEENARLKEDAEKRTHAERAAQADADRQHTVNLYRDTLKILGVPDSDKHGRPSNSVEAQLVAALIYKATTEHGVEYPPETLAHKVRQQMREAAKRYAPDIAAGGPQALLSNPGVVATLNALNPAEHGPLLEKLAPFMEMARAYNLQRRGLAAVPAAAQPAAPVVTGTAPTLVPGQEPRTTQDWVAYFKSGGSREGQRAGEVYWSLKDKGLLP